MSPALSTPGRPDAEFLLADAGEGARAFFSFVEDPRLRLTAVEDALSVEVEAPIRAAPCTPPRGRWSRI